MKPRRLKNIFASSKCVSPGMIPQKHGTTQFIGSFSRGCTVAMAWVGSKVSSSVSVAVGEGVSVANLTIPVGVSIGIEIVGTVAEGIVELTGAHAAKAKAGI